MALPCWIYRLSNFLNHNGQSDEQEARETAGNVISNYGAHIVTTMELLSHCVPSTVTAKLYSGSFVSNETWSVSVKQYSAAGRQQMRLSRRDLT